MPHFYMVFLFLVPLPFCHIQYARRSMIWYQDDGDNGITILDHWCFWFPLQCARRSLQQLRKIACTDSCTFEHCNRYLTLGSQQPTSLRWFFCSRFSFSLISTRTSHVRLPECVLIVNSAQFGSYAIKTIMSWGVGWCANLLRTQMFLIILIVH